MADQQQDTDSEFEEEDDEEQQRQQQEQQHLQHVVACLARMVDRLSVKPWLLAKFDAANASITGQLLPMFTHEPGSSSCGSSRSL
jgi:hypothetical protein